MIEPSARSRSPPGEVTSSSPLSAGSGDGGALGARPRAFCFVVGHEPNVTASSTLLRYCAAVVAGRIRLLIVYLVTTRVALSYLGLALARRFRRPEAIERLTQEKHRLNARRVEAAILRLRGLFIKVGQLISIMANVLPDAFREELERLQDQVPPRPYEDIEARLREEFGGRPPNEVFAEFSAEPVASASIGQVHRARLASGEEVAVKVQYPDIEEIVRIDLRALRRIFDLLRWFMPDYGFDTIYREIREMVIAELDYRREAAAIEKIAANFAARKKTAANVGFPRVIAEFSTARVLTTEWIEGTKVADLERLATLAVDRRAAARVCVEAYCQQIFIDGLYHADPAPRESAGAGAADSVGPAQGGVPRLRRDRHRQRGDAARDGLVPSGGDDPRHQPDRDRDARDGFHLASRRPGGVRPGGPVLPRQDARPDLDSRAFRSRT